MSLYGYQLTKAQENWFADNVEGYYQYAPNNLQNLFFLVSDSSLPDLKIYSPSLEVTTESFLLIGESEAVHLVFTVGLIWRDLRAVRLTHVPAINTNPIIAQHLNDGFEKLKPRLADMPDITRTFFNENGSIGGAFFGF